jgi:hypothetical protein
MTDHPMNRLSGLLPMFFSAIALVMVLHGYAEFRRHGPPTDEGGAEHVFLLALALEVPVIAWFVFTMRRELKRALPVLGGQTAMWVVAFAAGCLCPGFR